MAVTPSIKMLREGKKFSRYIKTIGHRLMPNTTAFTSIPRRQNFYQESGVNPGFVTAEITNKHHFCLP
jgi:tetrahydromethanopterin S-methyltransferase subunit B